MEKVLEGLAPIFLEFLGRLKDSFIEIPTAIRDEVPKPQMQLLV